MSEFARAAGPRLAACVSRLGYSRGPFGHRRELALPTGGVQMLINLADDSFHLYDIHDGRVSQQTGGVALLGPTDRPNLIDPAEQREIVWVAFRAGGARSFFPVEGADVRGRLIGLDDLLGRAGVTLREQLMEASGPDDALQYTPRRAADDGVMQTITSAYPRLIVINAAEAIAFYRDVFGAVELERHLDEDGRIVDAKVVIGSVGMAVRDEGYGDQAPPSLGGTPVIMAVETPDPDAVAAAMLGRGATVAHPVSDRPYGRAGRLTDPYGHQWMLLRKAAAAAR